MKWVIMALLLSGCASSTSTTHQKVSLHLLTLEATSNVVQEVKSKQYGEKKSVYELK